MLQLNKMDFASDEEIRYARDILLKDEETFDDEKIKIIKCNESKDIVACPGSGKTTTLLAKLVILSKRMPLAKGKGICVLTHTNVAIDEIKSKLKNQANILFNYPNYFGTIQGFVDKFFAIPYYNSTNTQVLSTIDDERAWERFLSNFKTKKYDELKHIWYQLSKKVQKEGGKALREAEQKLLYCSYYDPYGQKYHRKYKDKALAVDKNTDTYKLFDSTRGKCIKEGYLKFEDAYAYAIAYCKQCDDIKEIIAERFCYLFVDEMQDTNNLQSDLMDMLFDRDKVIIQRFGDPMQSIYEGDCEINWNPKDDYLSITKSMRLGSNTANLLNNIRDTKYNVVLKGNERICSLKPILIVYDKYGKVLPKFVELTKTKTVGGNTIYELAKKAQKCDPLHRCKIKAIGWRGKDDNGNICIGNYFDKFERKATSKWKRNPTKLFEFLRMGENFSIKNYSDRIFSALAYVLELNEIKYEYAGKSARYTKSRLKSYMREKFPYEYQEVREKISYWAICIFNSKLAIDKGIYYEVKSYIEGDFQQMFCFDKTRTEYLEFYTVHNANLIDENTSDASTYQNIYTYDDVEVEVATVHSVKGETHIATLFMETEFEGKCEIQRIGSQLCGIPCDEKNKYIVETLHIAYVAMSRPRYLLCMAIERDNYNKLDENNLLQLWDIVEA